MKRTNQGRIQAILKIAFLLSTAIFPQGRAEAQKPDTIRTLVLLVDFSDAPGALTVAQARDLLNTPGYASPATPINSRDYWSEISRNKVVVMHDVLGYYRAPQTAAYYRTKTYQEGITMAAEAFNWVARTMPGYDWNALSVKDNRFRGLTIVPSTSVPGSGATHYLGDRFIAPNKVKGNKLSVIDVGGSLFGFNHEFGHMVFDWPDTYSITGGHGTGAWELMSGSNSTPGIPNAAYRAGQGWMEMRDVAGQQVITLEENGPLAVRFRNPKDSMEYFVVEARNSSLRSTKAPALGRGLLIWHFDEKVPGNGNYEVNGEDMTLENHYEISLEQADGRFDLEKGRSFGDIGDAFLPGKSFHDRTVPDSRWWDGSPSGFGIDDIKWVDGDRISFRLTAPGTAPILAMGGKERNPGLWMEGDRLGFRVSGDAGDASIPTEISLHSLDGKRIADILKGLKQPGSYSISLTDLGKRPPGLYLGRIRAGSTEASAVLRLE